MSATRLCLSDLLEQAALRFGKATALVTDTETISYRELDRRARNLAAYLQSRGIKRGDAVALHLRNCAEYVVADLAILKLCAVKVPLNELMAESELQYCLEHADVKVLIAHASLSCPAQLPDRVEVMVSVSSDGEDTRSGWINWKDSLEFKGQLERQAAHPDDMASISYTGGTTGRPKGVHHSQHRLAVNLLGHVIYGDVRPDEVMLLTTPLPHSAGYHLQACLLQGGKIILARKFDADDFISMACEQAVTWTFAVPTMLYRIFDRINAGQAAPEKIRTIVYGAAPISSVRIAEGLKHFGPVFLQLFGQTECPNYITTLSKVDHLDERLLGSCGRPVPLVKLRIRNADGMIASCDEVGEVEVESPYLLIEYYKDSQATSAAIRDGWLCTGDIGRVDEEGYLFLVDRAKDMIISGGMNVYSVEVESALRLHEAIADVAIVGAHDPDWGEAVVAFVVASTPVEESALVAFAKQELSAYKVPKRVHFIDALPLTKYGKVDKKLLRDRA